MITFFWNKTEDGVWDLVPSGEDCGICLARIRNYKGSYNLSFPQTCVACIDTKDSVREAMETVEEILRNSEIFGKKLKAVRGKDLYEDNTEVKIEEIKTNKTYRISVKGVLKGFVKEVNVYTWETYSKYWDWYSFENNKNDAIKRVSNLE